MHQQISGIMIWRYRSYASLTEAQINPTPHKHTGGHKHSVPAYQHSGLPQRAFGGYAPTPSTGYVSQLAASIPGPPSAGFPKFPQHVKPK